MTIYVLHFDKYYIYMINRRNREYFPFGTVNYVPRKFIKFETIEQNDRSDSGGCNLNVVPEKGNHQQDRSLCLSETIPSVARPSNGTRPVSKSIFQVPKQTGHYFKSVDCGGWSGGEEGSLFDALTMINDDGRVAAAAAATAAIFVSLRSPATISIKLPRHFMNEAFRRRNETPAALE